MKCITCSKKIPTGIYPFDQCGKCIDNNVEPPKATKDKTSVKLAFTQFDVADWEITIYKGDITDKLLLKQLRGKGIKNRNIEFMFDEKKNYYSAFSCNTVPEPLGNITITIKDVK